MKIGKEYLGSPEEERFNRWAVRALRLPQHLARLGAQATFGYQIHTDLRVGQNEALVAIPKIQTLDEDGNPLSPIAEAYRAKGLDEFEQLDLVKRGIMSFIGSRHLLPEDVENIKRIARRTNRGRRLLAMHRDIVLPQRRGILSSFGLNAHIFGDDSVEARLALDIQDYLQASTSYNLRLITKGTRSLALNELTRGTNPVLVPNDNRGINS